MPVAVLARYPHQTTRPPAPTARHQTRRWHLPVLPHPYRTSRDRRRPPPYRTHHHPSSRLTNLLTSCKHLARKLLIISLWASRGSFSSQRSAALAHRLGNSRHSSLTANGSASQSR